MIKLLIMKGLEGYERWEYTFCVTDNPENVFAQPYHKDPFHWTWLIQIPGQILHVIEEEMKGKGKKKDEWNKNVNIMKSRKENTS